MFSKHERNKFKLPIGLPMHMNQALLAILTNIVVNFHKGHGSHKFEMLYSEE